MTPPFRVSAAGVDARVSQSGGRLSLDHAGIQDRTSRLADNWNAYSTRYGSDKSVPRGRLVPLDLTVHLEESRKVLEASKRETRDKLMNDPAEWESYLPILRDDPHVIQQLVDFKILSDEDGKTLMYRLLHRVIDERRLLQAEQNICIGIEYQPSAKTYNDLLNEYRESVRLYNQSFGIYDESLIPAGVHSVLPPKEKTTPLLVVPDPTSIYCRDGMDAAITSLAGTWQGLQLVISANPETPNILIEDELRFLCSRAVRRGEGGQDWDRARSVVPIVFPAVFSHQEDRPHAIKPVNHRVKGYVWLPLGYTELEDDGVSFYVPYTEREILYWDQQTLIEMQHDGVGSDPPVMTTSLSDVIGQLLVAVADAVVHDDELDGISSQQARLIAVCGRFWECYTPSDARVDLNRSAALMGTVGLLSGTKNVGKLVTPTTVKHSLDVEKGGSPF